MIEELQTEKSILEQVHAERREVLKEHMTTGFGDTSRKEHTG
jgi:hypothetical protein